MFATDVTVGLAEWINKLDFPGKKFPEFLFLSTFILCLE